MYSVRYIPHSAIDHNKWDQCIDASTNGLIYGYSWYLDACGVKWDALVLNDYEAVMPLCWNRKYGINYLFQPWFCACLGVFSRTTINCPLIDAFLNAIPKKFRYVDICMNYENKFQLHHVQTTDRVSYILSLAQPYDELEKNYRTQLKRNLSKAKQAGLIAKWDIDIDSIFPFAKEIMQRVSSISDEEVQRMIPLLESVQKHKKAETIGIYSSSEELLASAVFFYSHQRWYYLIVGNHPNGKTMGASHYLIDRFIEKHANTNELLDFEGSDIRNIAYFYSSFGAHAQTYPAIKINRLPAIIRWLKQ